MCVLQAIGIVQSLDTGILCSSVLPTTVHPPTCVEMEPSVFPNDRVGGIPTSLRTVTFRKASLSMVLPTFTHNRVKKAKGQCASHLYKAVCYVILTPSYSLPLSLSFTSQQLFTWKIEILNKGNRFHSTLSQAQKVTTITFLQEKVSWACLCKTLLTQC